MPGASITASNLSPQTKATVTKAILPSKLGTKQRNREINEHRKKAVWFKHPLMQKYPMESYYRTSTSKPLPCTGKMLDKIFKEFWNRYSRNKLEDTRLPPRIPQPPATINFSISQILSENIGPNLFIIIKVNWIDYRMKSILLRLIQDFPPAPTESD